MSDFLIFCARSFTFRHRAESTLRRSSATSDRWDSYPEAQEEACADTHCRSSGGRQIG